MRKIMLPLVLSVLLICSGCQSVATQADDNQLDITTEMQAVYGKIKEINGNELLLVVGSYDQQSGPPDSGQEEPSDGQRPSRGNRDGQAEGEGGSRPDRGARGEGTFPGGEEGGSRPDRTAREDEEASGEEGGRSGRNQGGGDSMPGRQASFTLSGEEVTYLIPVTAGITTGQGEQAKTIRFTQLAVKNIVCLRLDQSGAVQAVEVVA